MPYISDIATAVPGNAITNEEVITYYTEMLNRCNETALKQRIPKLVTNSYIERRYSCLPDFNTSRNELFSSGNYNPDVGKRLAVYNEKVLPLAIEAVDSLLHRTGVSLSGITHIITVSCTGMSAPGLEFRIAEHYNLMNIEKTALNYLGCYAAIQAVREADYIARACPDARILIVCVELCSLHFNSSFVMEEVIANLLFADGAAALFVMGDKVPVHEEIPGFHIDATSCYTIPDTMELMTWSITSASFRMYLNRGIAEAIRIHAGDVVRDFISEDPAVIDCWAIHPGGIRILRAVQEALKLPDEKIAPSLEILQLYGNMSSPTVLFILQKIFSRLRRQPHELSNKKIVTCAFGPGLNIELLRLSPVLVKHKMNIPAHRHAIPNTVN
jgi:predicted naringenin-chalcone synthase